LETTFLLLINDRKRNGATMPLFHQLPPFFKYNELKTQFLTKILNDFIVSKLAPSRDEDGIGFLFLCNTIVDGNSLIIEK
jgi:hypothetical protein